MCTECNGKISAYSLFITAQNLSDELIDRLILACHLTLQ